VAEQMLLFDPFGTQSWVLANDDSAWQVWKTHESLPLPQGVELPENTRGTEHRFTQWWAPYFAYWDLERGAPTVVFYDSPHSLCLPVEGLGLPQKQLPVFERRSIPSACVARPRRSGATPRPRALAEVRLDAQRLGSYSCTSP